MHWFNHFFFSMNLLILFFRNKSSFEEMVIFTVLFALFIDFDFLFRRYVRGNKGANLRTWIQEPFGIILFALPIAIIMGLFKQVYFYLVMTAFVSHIILDYVTMRKAFPLSPFSNKEVDVGFIGKINLGKKKPKLRLKTIKDKFDENHFLVINIAIFLLLYTKFY